MSRGVWGAGAPQRPLYKSVDLHDRVGAVPCVLLIIEELRLSAFQRIQNRRKRISPARDTGTFTYRTLGGSRPPDPPGTCTFIQRGFILRGLTDLIRGVLAPTTENIGC